MTEAAIFGVLCSIFVSLQFINYSLSQIRNELEESNLKEKIK